MVAHLLWEQEVGGSKPPSPTGVLLGATVRTDRLTPFSRIPIPTTKLLVNPTGGQSNSTSTIRPELRA